LSKACLRFEYRVLRGGEVLVTGHTRHACVELATGRPSRMPEQLRAAARGPS
jgi:acyl-CoA thioester hydrolase